MHQSIQWAKESPQDYFFFKLDVKAYDRVDWMFMFKVIEKLGNDIELIMLALHDPSEQLYGPSRLWMP
jgi:hypothetical protein